MHQHRVMSASHLRFRSFSDLFSNITTTVVTGSPWNRVTCGEPRSTHGAAVEQPKHGGRSATSSRLDLCMSAFQNCSPLFLYQIGKTLITCWCMNPSEKYAWSTQILGKFRNVSNHQPAMALWLWEEVQAHQKTGSISTGFLHQVDMLLSSHRDHPTSPGSAAAWPRDDGHWWW